MTRPGARDRLLDATITLVRERGVHGTGIADVLERSGAARGSVYQHFPEGKTALVAAAVQRAGDYLDEHVLAQAATPTDQLDALAAWWVRRLERHDFAVGCPVAAAAVDDTPEVLAATAAVFTAWSDRISATLVEHGRSPDEARRLASVILSAFEGAVLQCRAARSTTPIDDVRDVLRPLLA